MLIDLRTDKILNIWKCDCGEEATVTPDWYECNGTPMCVECDDDMAFDRVVAQIDNDDFESLREDYK
jgi:hypothetical protein